MKKIVKNNMDSERNGFVGLIVGVVVFIFGLFALASSIESVDIGERVVVVGFGEVKEVLAEGFHFVNPFYSTYSFDVRNTKYETTAASQSSDLQKVGLSVAVNYELSPDSVADVYKTYGQNYIERVFAQNVQEAIKSVAAKYPATELITKRDEVRDLFKTRLQESLPVSVKIVDVAITNVDYSDTFDQAVETKVKAEQDALTAKNRLEQIKFEADQRVAQAEGEAKAIKAQAEAITKAGGKEYVQLKWIEKWSGNLPNYMLDGSNTLLLDLSK